MLSCEKKDSAPEGFVLLPAGPELFDDLDATIDAAKQYVILKSFLWRNDAAGQRMARSLYAAAERGCKILILKDRIGAFFEFAEGNGQSFFHDTPQDDPLFDSHSLQTVYAQARAVGRFYKNSPGTAVPNPLRNDFIEHPNITVIDDFKLYDHSKVIIVDGQTAYLGGVGFGEEFMEPQNHWIDFMLKISGPVQCAEFILVVGGLPSYHQDTDTEFYSGEMNGHLLKFIAGAEEQLDIEMAFLGNPQFIDAIAKRVAAGVRTQIYMPATASSHNFRNLHFIRKLMDETADRRELLSVHTLPKMVHTKLLMRDSREVFFGSANLSSDSNVLYETNMRSASVDLFAAFQKALAEHHAVSAHMESPPKWRDFLVRWSCEYFAVKNQKLAMRLRRKQVEKIRRACQQEICLLLNLPCRIPGHLP